MLNTVHHGTDTGAPPLLIVHGLFGSARNWGAIAKRMGKSRTVWTVDMRNHGDSPWVDSHSYADMAEDLADVIATTGGAMDVLGHSMGGKAAMVLALSQPELVNRLLVADIAPVAYRHTQTPMIDAMQWLDLSQVSQRKDADTLLQTRIDDPAVRAFLLQSLDLKGDAPRWRLNLPVLKAEMDKVIGFPQVSGQFDRPTFFIAGGLSDYILPIHRERILTLFPNADYAVIKNAGHWVHAEAPGHFISEVEGFLNRSDG